MANIVKYNEEAKELMANGIKTLYDAVRVTLGPKGRNVIIEQDFGSPLIVNDGVTIAKSIILENKFENLGASVLIEAASKTNDQVGDGTTTAIILAYNIIKEGLDAIRKGVNPVTIRNGLNYYLGHILEAIDKVSTSITSSDDLRHVATISSQSKEIGDFIASAYDEVGRDGLVMVEESQSLNTYLDVVKGYSYDRGYLSLYMVNDKEKMQAVLDKPYILVTDKKIVNMQEILPHLEKTMKSGKPLLIICDDIEQEVLSALIVNKLRGVFNVVVTKAPSFGDRKVKLLEDIATVTGSTFVDSNIGMSLNDEQIILGSASKVVISKEQTVIIDGAGDKDDILKRAESIRLEINHTTSEYDQERLKERLAKILGGVALIKVGASTEIELKELKLRVEDALNATKAAMQEGIIEGGGKVFYEISDQLRQIKREPEYGVVCDILSQVLKKPFQQIVENAGADFLQVIKEVNATYWFDASTSKLVRLKQAGIIDPVSVEKSAITSAISIASIFLTTECAIVKNEPAAPLKEDDLV